MLGMCSTAKRHSSALGKLTSDINEEKKYTVVVEGNIGSGKSTFLQHFNQRKNVEVYAEPVEMWKNVRGHNTLDLMYKDPCRWSLTFQSYVQLTMLQVHTCKQMKPVKMMERSIYSARNCFIENLYRSDRMPSVDHDILLEWYSWILENEPVGIDLIVYLRASPETCLERIKHRNRSEECSVSLDYLETLHDLHEDWLIHRTMEPLPCPVLVLDGEQNMEELKKDLDMKTTEILCGCA